MYFEDVWNAQMLDSLPLVTTPDVVMCDQCCWQEEFRGQARLRRVIDEYLAGYKSFSYDVQHMMVSADGTVVLAKWAAEAMHLGAFLGIQASGRIEALQGMTTFEVRDGKICRIETFRTSLCSEVGRASLMHEV